MSELEKTLGTLIGLAGGELTREIAKEAGASESAQEAYANAANVLIALAVNTAVDRNSSEQHRR